MIDLTFEKIYSIETKNENCSIAVPFKRGQLKDIAPEDILITDERGKICECYGEVLSRWEDRSIKWLFVRFEADIPKNRSSHFTLYTDRPHKTTFDISSVTLKNGIINTGTIQAETAVGNSLFKYIEYNGIKYNDPIRLPVLKDKKGSTYTPLIEKWEIIESSPLIKIIRATGWHTLKGKNVYKFQVTLTFYRGKAEFNLGYRLINTTEERLDIKSLSLKTEINTLGKTRVLNGIANKKTKYKQSDGESIYTSIESSDLIYNDTEHNPEVFYGTLFSDITDENMGMTAVIYQPHQNFPKAVEAQKDKMEIYIVPMCSDSVSMEHGMASEQNILFYFHPANEALESINHRAILYQMPDRPVISPDVYRESGVFPNVFTRGDSFDTELFILLKADEHSRAFGMMNWGDAPDMGYTAQGRGQGSLVWTNNEYDFPHACILQYIRTGTRRFLDYAITAARHWIDVDICHFSNDPLKVGGQYEHSKGHILGEHIVCSHQWVEGLLDIYHLTGNKDAFEAAIGIGENILRLLDSPKFNTPGETSARETGWALRSLTALYIETGNKKWLSKCEGIVNHFKVWEEKYGHWLTPYMDNTVIRIPFMISVAAGSLMRYYKVKPSEELKEMILRSVDDLLENCRLENGLFFYKELPSLKRTGINPLMLEALVCAYELSGNREYLKAGLPTLKYITSFKPMSVSFDKRMEEGSLIIGNAGTKSFAQLMIPVAVFCAMAEKEGIM